MERQQSEDTMTATLVEEVRASRLPPADERRRIREEAGVTIRRMAEALEVDAMTVLRWERGSVAPRIDHAIAYRRLLDGLAEAVR